MELLGAERDALQQKLKDVTESTHAEAEQRLARDRKHLEKDAAERIERLTDSLETMQVSHVFLARSPAGAQTAAKAHKEPRTIRKRALCSVKEACCRGLCSGWRTR